MGGGGGGAYDVRGFYGGFGGVGDVDGGQIRVAGGEAGLQGFCVVWVAAPEADAVYIPDEGDGFDVAFGLFAGAEDGEGMGVGSGEGFCGGCAGGGGADGGQFGGVEDDEGLAVGGFEEDDDALVGGVAGGAVGVEDGDELDADDIWSLGEAGHHAEEAAVVGEPHEGSQGLEDAASGEVAEHGFHNGDAFGHGEEGRYLFFIYILRFHIIFGPCEQFIVIF